MRKQRLNSKTRPWLCTVIKRSLFIPFVLYILFSHTLLGQIGDETGFAKPLSEEEAKAAFIYQFTNFIEWPEETADTDVFTLCFAGYGRLKEELRNFEGVKIKGHPLVIKNFYQVPALDSCRILYVSSTEQHQLKRILRSIYAKPVLTISEIQNFIEYGGIINFVLDRNKIRFEINRRSAAQSKLKISSKLLDLAFRVIR